MDRRTLSDAFVAQAGWSAATRSFLAGDASDRSYDRLVLGDRSAVLMDAPPGADDPAVFARIASHLAALGLSPPQVLASDYANGFLLLEDLGDGLFARLVARDPSREAELYAAAVDALVTLQRATPLPDLHDLSADDWAKAAEFAFTWYRFAATGEASGDLTVLAHLMRRHADGPRVMILRDYHAENLLWLPQRSGVARVGLLDFQLGQLGQPGYDLVSLLQDARRDVSPETEAAMKARFVAATGAQDFDVAYAVLGAQRALRIMGVFARLCLKSGKAGYLPLMPRVWGQLQRNLAHPALADLAQACRALPEPTADTLERISAKCGTMSLR